MVRKTVDSERVLQLYLEGEFPLFVPLTTALHETCALRNDLFSFDR